MEANKETYSSKKVIAYYKKYESLQKPEESIFNLLKNKLSSMKMLDIGIGAGRTTIHFAPHVKEYIGVDYVAGMVDACKHKFSNKFPLSMFQIADARKLDQFIEHEFDFVLFSFNGIDYISPDERFLALQQINRVIKPEGYFCFSSHNIQSLENPAKFKLRLNLFALIKQIIVWQKVKKTNRQQFAVIKTSEFISINDGVHDFGLQTYYFRPIVQQKILHKAGFKNVRFFSLETGLEIDNENISISTSTDRWIYYLCQKV
jgi:ubiquinone/menaquinone biosynthesis C-methylase UbiE